MIMAIESFFSWISLIGNSGKRMCNMDFFACNCSRHVHVALVNWAELLLNLNRLKPLPIYICYAVVLSWNWKRSASLMKCVTGLCTCKYSPIYCISAMMLAAFWSTVTNNVNYPAVLVGTFHRLCLL
jgi:hypothetical protein